MSAAPRISTKIPRKSRYIYGGKLYPHNGATTTKLLSPDVTLSAESTRYLWCHALHEQSQPFTQLTLPGVRFTRLTGKKSLFKEILYGIKFTVVLQTESRFTLFVFISRNLFTLCSAFWKEQGRMFYFNDALNKFDYGYIGVRHLVKKHVGYSFRLPASDILYELSNRQDNTYHNLWYISRWNGTKDQW